MQVRPITPAIGAEVSGVDLTAISDQTFSAIEAAFTEYCVLVFRDQQELTPAQQVTFAKRFGDLHAHPAAPTLEGHAEIFVIHAHAQSKVANGNGWHTMNPNMCIGGVMQAAVWMTARGVTPRRYIRW